MPEQTNDMGKMTTEQWLRAKYAEPVPQWLKDYTPGKKVSPKEALSGHVVYYPGCGNDGEPVRIFNQSHSAHVFLYVDYGISRERLEQQLNQAYFTGYHSLGKIEYREQDIASAKFVPHVDLAKVSQSVMEFQRRVTAGIAPYCLVEILERDPDRNDDFGAERFAVVFLCSDGIAAYDALFCSGIYPVPFTIVLHDHGFGGNYNKFGRDGLLEECAVNTGSFPKFLLVADNTETWSGYSKVEDIIPAVASEYRVKHDLYCRD